MTTTRTKITPEAVAAYKTARAIYDAPIPADPVRRILENREYNKFCETLRQELDRAPSQISVMDTIDDEMPVAVVRGGPTAVADWQEAAAIRRELERRCRLLVT